jgi:shikimate dehydrogenase
MSAMLEALRAPECLGANVTVPHKQTILHRLDSLSELALQIGAVNTIVKKGEQLIGENTDVYGFTHALAIRRVRLKNASVAIFGAGGGAAAAAFAAAKEGAREIILLNRTTTRAEALAERILSHQPMLRIAINDWDAAERSDLVINATSLGMKPHVEASPLPDTFRLPPRAIAFDLVYNPPLTKFLKQAKEQGARVIGGLEMLVYQGARAFELWTAKRAPIRVMKAAAQTALASF